MGRGDAAATGEQQDAWPGLQGLRGHTIICGCMSSLAPFVTQLRLCDRSLRPVVVLAPEKPQAQWRQVVASGPALFVKGSPTDAAALKAAKLSTARSIAYLADLARPEQSKGHLSEMGLSAAVLEDAEALLTCYGVGEERSLETTHAVAELTFTSSVRFLQPGLLLKGAYQWEKPQGSGAERAPRRSWMMRRNRERAAVQAGLAEWQANPYYCAGRAVVPAVLDSFTCQCFFNQGRLLDVMRELCGDEGPHTGGCLLRMLPVPEGLEGRTYGELVQQLMLAQRLIPLGLYRRKGENPAWRLQYVYTNPFWHERLEATDYVYVLREWGGVWED